MSKPNAPKPSPDVVTRRVEDRVVLFQISRSQTFALSETGARLWELLSEGKNESEALKHMVAEFDVPEEDLRIEAREFLDSLEREGLLVRSDT
jgi:Coenzyme PQQ synthesis protein D (PqqD)